MIGLVAGVYATSFAQTNNKIIVKVEQINSAEGSINVAVFNSEKTFLKTPFLTQSADAKTGEMIFEFEEVPNGEYTISIYHDMNENGELDKNLMGIPNEPYGVSKEGKSMFGPPSYQDALFTVENINVDLKISLD